MGLIILGGIIGNCRVNRWSDFFIAMFTIALFEGFGLATAFAIGVKDSKSDNNGMVFMMIPPTLLISAPLIGLGLMIGWKLRLEKRTSKRT